MSVIEREIEGRQSKARHELLGAVGEADARHRADA